MSKIACVILPTYNEAENLRQLVPLVFEQGGRIPTHELHVLVVDDDSPDGTADVARHLMKGYRNLHLLTGHKEGLGVAYQRGFDHALRQLQADLVFQMDADFQHDPSLIPLFVSLTEYGFTLVVGSRFAPGGRTVNFGLRRRIISRLGSALVQVFGGIGRVHDCTSGFRCIKGSVLKTCNVQGFPARGYSFQSLLLCELLWHGARIVEIPIIFRERVSGCSKLGLRDQVEFVTDLLRLRVRRWKRGPSWKWRPELSS